MGQSNIGYWHDDRPTMATVKKGDGINFPKKGDFVIMDYTANYYKNGVKAGSSKLLGKPVKFQIGQGLVNNCWEWAIPRMSKGERIQLNCPANYGYE